MSQNDFDQDQDVYFTPKLPNPTTQEFEWPAPGSNSDQFSGEVVDTSAVWPEVAENADIAETLQLELDAIKGLRALQKLSHRTALSRGWYHDPETGEEKPRDFGTVIALMHSELSEALEADRQGLNDDKLPHRDGREVEFGDLILRVLDTAEHLGLDVGAAAIEKNRYNLKRVDHDPKTRSQKGGKRY